jgi:hypothetical protein
MFMFMGLRMVTYDKYILVHKFRMRGYSRTKTKNKSHSLNTRGNKRMNKKYPTSTGAGE